MKCVFTEAGMVNQATPYAEIRRNTVGGMAYMLPLVPPEKMEHGLKLYAITSARLPDGYAYRYSDGLRFNDGSEVNGSKPLEAVPYWLGSTKPASTFDPWQADKDAQMNPATDGDPGLF